MARQNYKKTDIKLNLIQALRQCPMTFEAIKSFLSQEYQRNGKVGKKTGIIQDYEVSDKTVHRMINSIQEMYPKEFSKSEYDKTYSLDLCGFPDTITDEDIQALDIVIKKTGKDAKEILKSLKTKLASKLERARGKKESEDLEDILETTNFFVIGPQAQIDISQDIRNALTKAIHRQHKLTITYDSKPTPKEYTVCPLGMLHGPNNIYLIALMNEKYMNSMTTFMVTKIIKAKETSEYFTKDNNFSMQQYANSMFGIPYNEETKKEYDIEWLIKKEIKNSAKKYIFHPTQVFTDNADGSMTVKFHACNIDAIAKYICQWAGKIVPIAPKELVIKYHDLLNECLSSLK